MNEDLKLKTPCCGRAVRGVANMRYATMVIDRTCPKCHGRFRIVVEPIEATLDYQVHAATWTSTA